MNRKHASIGTAILGLGIYLYALYAPVPSNQPDWPGERSFYSHLNFLAITLGLTWLLLLVMMMRASSDLGLFVAVVLLSLFSLSVFGELLDGKGMSGPSVAPISVLVISLLAVGLGYGLGKVVQSNLKLKRP